MLLLCNWKKLQERQNQHSTEEKNKMNSHKTMKKKSHWRNFKFDFQHAREQDNFNYEDRSTWDPRKTIFDYLY